MTTRVLLLVDHARNRRLLEGWLASRDGYNPILPEHADADPLDREFDVCVVDETASTRHRDALRERRAADPAYLPILLLKREEGVDRPVTPDFASTVVGTPAAVEEVESLLAVLADRRRRSRALVDAREELRETFGATHDAVLVVDPVPDAILAATPRARGMLGYASNEPIDRPASDVLHDGLDAFVDCVLADGRGRTRDLRVAPAAGPQVPVDVSAVPLDVPGAAEPTVAVGLRDLATRTADEGGEDHGQEPWSHRLDRTFENAYRALVRAKTRRMAEEDVCAELSSAERYVGAWIGRVETGAREVVPTAWSGLNRRVVDRASIPLDETSDGESLEAAVSTALRSRKVGVSHVHGDVPERSPESISVAGSVAAVPIAYRDDLHGILVVYASSADAFHGAEEAELADLGETICHAIDAIEAREEAELFQRAVDQSGHSIYITAPDATIEYVNPTFEEQTGYSAEEAIGRTPRILASGKHDASFYAELWSTILNGDVWKSEIVNRRKNGQLYYIDQTIAPVTDEIGEIHHFVAINSEKTDHLVRTQQNQVLNRILRHTLRNRLNVVDGHAQLVTDDERDVDEHVEKIRTTVSELLRVSDKADRITALFRGDLSARPREVVSVVTDVCSTIEERYPHATIKIEIPPEEVVVWARFERAVEEILENAVEHADRVEPEIAIRVYRRNDARDRVTIEVEDDGPGIPPDERRVLERGEETPLYHGSGLGLWLVHWIVMVAGGEVDIDDRTPRGTSVRLTFPAESGESGRQIDEDERSGRRFEGP